MTIQSMVNRFPEKRYLEIENILSTYESFDKYLNIQNNDNIKLKIKINKSNRIYGNNIFVIDLNIYTRISDTQRLLLLNKIMKQKNITNNLCFHFHSLLDKEIDMNIQICFKKSYPFSPPWWILNNIKTNIEPPQIELEKYYKYIILKHNRMNHNSWCPAISMSKDIVEFIQKINHFEYIKDY
tara:strand:+ start:95 stop:643 length:549 start_codon:yes stop_codon:yes gene_type:complete